MLTTPGLPKPKFYTASFTLDLKVHSINQFQYLSCSTSYFLFPGY